MRKTDILILGNGAAGSSAAFAAKQTAPELNVLVLSKEDEPVYSAPALPDLLSGELTRAQVTVSPWDDYRNAGIEALCASAVRIDAGTRTVILENGGEVSYGELILATGSQPIRLRKMQGTGLPGNFVMKTIADVEDMAAYGGSRAVVVGSGAIGIEGSMALKARGFEQVVMVEALEWLSPKSLDRATSDELKAKLESFGVKVLTGEAVQGVLGETKVEGVRTEKRDIPCDLILWGIGMRPDTELAKAAGIECGASGAILTDDHMRTNLPHVYACGDCTESVDVFSGQRGAYLFWEPARRGGAAAGVNAAEEGQDVRQENRPRVFLGTTPFFLTNKGGLSILAMGRTEAQLAEGRGTVLEEKKDGVYRRLLFEDGKLAGAQMLGTLEDADLFAAQIRKNAMQREDTWDLTEPVPNLEQLSLQEAVFFLRKQRRNAFSK
ncbi:MAG: NAD(P)/FAD-dependent oxidoreductase [Firmicutes bacterium]|nr:NAD(P)/FAD-dependent oxidoreductase [Bacillota bacterium]